MPKLWYKTPAREYMAGLPVGNGRLAAMVLGDPCCERLALNHEWLWRGCNRQRECDASADRLAAVRELLLAGDLAEGTRQGDWAFGGGGGGHPEKRPSRVDPYQPAGDLTFRPEHSDRWTAYRRELDLGRGVASVSYRVGKLICCREVIADAGEGDCLLMHLSFSRRANGRLSLDRREDPRCSVKRWAEPDGLRLEGIFRGGLAFRVEADVVFCDGDMSIREGDLWLSGVTDAVVAVSIGTSADTASLSDQCASQWGHDMAWEKILAQHCQQWYSIGGRPMLSLWQAALDLPTDERLRRARAGEPDPTLPALYFEYGRYLLQACTLKGDLPPNLQGKW
ncbi:MAG: glycoside hydrolase family 95 protein, partial [Lentisphaerae bacterium]|nr:glycoside hydrolase family 95 protein [Lentisphaerota bacterium]